MVLESAFRMEVGKRMVLCASGRPEEEDAVIKTKDKGLNESSSCVDVEKVLFFGNVLEELAAGFGSKCNTCRVLTIYFLEVCLFQRKGVW